MDYQHFQENYSLSIVAITSDNRAEVVGAFFSMLRKYAPSLPAHEVFLLCETEDYGHPRTVVTGKGVPFNKRLLLCLNQLKSDYVFLLIDDYFLYRPWDDFAYLGRLLAEMGQHEVRYCNVSRQCKGHRAHGLRYLCELERPDFYGVSLQPSIWNRSFLERVVGNMPDGDPWSFEKSFWYDPLIYQKVIQGKPMHSKKTVFKCVNGITAGRLFRHSDYVLRLNGIDLRKHFPLLPLKTSAHFYWTKFWISHSKKYRNKIKRTLE